MVVAFRILLVAIPSIGAVVVVLALGILVGKARREIVARRERVMRQTIEPRLLSLNWRPAARGEGHRSRSAAHSGYYEHVERRAGRRRL